MKKSNIVLFIMSLVLILALGIPSFSEEYPGRMAAIDLQNMIGKDVVVVVNPKVRLYEVLDMEKLEVQKMMNKDPYYTFRLYDTKERIDLDYVISLKEGEFVTIEISSDIGMGTIFEVHYYQYETVAPEVDNPEDFEDIYGEGPGIDDGFSDVSTDDWYGYSVLNLASMGIINGYEDGSFRPSNNVTYEEFMVMLNRALDIISPSYVQGPINNLSLSGLPGWAKGDITSIVRKVSDTAYDEISIDFNKLNTPIKRSQVALFTSESINFANKDLPHDFDPYFKDVKLPYTIWCIGNLVEVGIINGYQDGTFRPNNNITRAEVASIISNLISTEFDF